MDILETSFHDNATISSIIHIRVVIWSQYQTLYTHTSYLYALKLLSWLIEECFITFPSKLHISFLDMTNTAPPSHSSDIWKETRRREEKNLYSNLEAENASKLKPIIFISVIKCASLRPLIHLPAVCVLFENQATIKLPSPLPRRLLSDKTTIKMTQKRHLSNAPLIQNVGAITSSICQCYTRYRVYIRQSVVRCCVPHCLALFIPIFRY